jgi:hypothetical protein
MRAQTVPRIAAEVPVEVVGIDDPRPAKLAYLENAVAANLVLPPGPIAELDIVRSVGQPSSSAVASSRDPGSMREAR